MAYWNFKNENTGFGTLGLATIIKVRKKSTHSRLDFIIDISKACTFYEFKHLSSYLSDTFLGSLPRSL